MIIMTLAFFTSQKIRSAFRHGQPATSVPDDENDHKTQRRFDDLVDIRYIDLYADEHDEDEDDCVDNETRAKRLKGRWRLLWRLWDWIA